MDTTQERLNEISAEIQQRQSERAKAEYEAAQAEKRIREIRADLEESFGVKTIEEARALVAEYEQALETELDLLEDALAKAER